MEAPEHLSDDVRAIWDEVMGRMPEGRSVDATRFEVYCTQVHAFRKAYGTSPINYLISRRIQESRFLLTNSNHSLSQIARILGFSSLSYFSQSFHRTEGVSPMEYRKLHTAEARQQAGESGG